MESVIIMKKVISGSAFFLLLDQLIKCLIQSFLELNQSITIIPDFFHITYTRNTGAAWSILEGNTLILIGITFLALYYLYEFFLKNQTFTKLDILTYSLLIGGILGNLIDRIFLHSVVDYLDFTFFSYHFPIFNLADSCIVTGVGLLIIKILRGEKHGAH